MFDVHTHIWNGEAQLGKVFAGAYKNAYGDQALLKISLDEYRKNVLSKTDGAVILPIRSTKIGMDISNEYIADCCSELGDKVIGFACVDPNEPDALDRLRHAIMNLGLQGLKLAPAYQLFDPLDKKAMQIYQLAEELEIPILWHQGTTFIKEAPLKHCQPVLLDEVAKRFPRLKMIIAHMGFPWVEDTIALVRMHKNVYADVSALSGRKWKFWTTLMLASESRVVDKLLFGSDFPFDSPMESAERFRAIARWQGIPGMPSLEGIVDRLIERDTVRLLYG